MRIFILFLIVITQQFYAQQLRGMHPEPFHRMYPEKEFIHLDSLNTNQVKEYTLKTKDIYNVDTEIKMYNIFIGNNKILLLSVLPDYEKPNHLWQEINVQEIPKNKILSANQVEHLAINDFFFDENFYNGKTFRYKIIKNENGKFFVSHQCLTEAFAIVEYPHSMVAPYGMLNKMEQTTSIEDMRQVFTKQFSSMSFPLDIRESGMLFIVDSKFVVKNYLSKTYKINNHKAYQFWTMMGWYGHDTNNQERGIDRLVYIDGLGIVGGSYDFYFNFRPKFSVKHFVEDTNHLWQNILNEKVMIARELK